MTKGKKGSENALCLQYDHKALILRLTTVKTGQHDCVLGSKLEHERYTSIWGTVELFVDHLHVLSTYRH
jgi:hypothetical protein